MRLLLSACALFLLSCGREEAPLPSPDHVGISGARRLTVAEYDATIRDLLLDESRPAEGMLPADVVDPFDNDFTLQEPTSVLVTGLEALAGDVAVRFVADPARRDAVVRCDEPTPENTACIRRFVERFGRLALRRPIGGDEVDPLVQLGSDFAQQEGDFWEGIDVVVRVFLQHPEFVYRIERGTPTGEPGVYQLNSFEVATRLSYFLWGTTPDDRLLSLAEQSLLSNPALVREIAADMLADPRALDRVDRFHAMWLGYWALPHDPQLTAAMRSETHRLIEEVVFLDQTSWLDVFTMDGTWVNDELAAHYGLDLPGSTEPVWVPYDETTRQGILSHGSFLSVAGKFGDTSPTQRGKLVRNRLMCMEVPPPPPDVNVDEPPDSPDSDCKIDRYAAHREAGTSCNNCHRAIDPIGFGLENYDQAGVYREHDNGFPECEITGDGDVDGVAFNGPSGLADVLLDGDVLTDCVVDQMYRFAMGHGAVEEDLPLVESLQKGFGKSGHRMDQLMLDLVSDPSFQYRREETP